MFVTPKGRSKNAVKGWQLVGRGEPSEVVPNNDTTARPLTYKEIEQMSAADAEWHMIHNKQAWQAAVDEEQRLRLCGEMSACATQTHCLHGRPFGPRRESNDRTNKVPLLSSLNAFYFACAAILRRTPSPNSVCCAERAIRRQQRSYALFPYT